MEEKNWYSNLSYKRLNLNIFAQNVYNDFIPFSRLNRTLNKKVDRMTMMYDFNKYINSIESLMLFLDNVVNLINNNGYFMILTISRDYVNKNLDKYIFDIDGLKIQIEVLDDNYPIQKARISYNDGDFTDLYLLDNNYMYNIFFKIRSKPNIYTRKINTIQYK